MPRLRCVYTSPRRTRKAEPGGEACGTEGTLSCRQEAPEKRTENGCWTIGLLGSRTSSLTTAELSFFRFCQRQTSAGAQNPLRSHSPHPDTHGSRWLLLPVTDLKLNLRTTSTILSFYQSSERASNWPKVTQQECLKYGGHPHGLTPSLGSCAAQCCSQR